MRIGIDIDGVLTDIEQWQLDYGSKFIFEQYHKGIINSEGYDIEEIFNVDKKVEDEFWEKYLYEYVKNEPARKFASEVIKKMKEEGKEIYIITARYLTNRDTAEGESMRQIVKKWLKENKIYYDKIIFSPEDKVENINNISKNIPVICFNARYNKECNGKNIYRCYSWYDVYDKIKNIENNI